MQEKINAIFTRLREHGAIVETDHMGLSTVSYQPSNEKVIQIAGCLTELKDFGHVELAHDMPFIRVYAFVSEVAQTNIEKMSCWVVRQLGYESLATAMENESVNHDEASFEEALAVICALTKVNAAGRNDDLMAMREMSSSELADFAVQINKPFDDIDVARETLQGVIDRLCLIDLTTYKAD